MNRREAVKLIASAAAVAWTPAQAAAVRRKTDAALAAAAPAGGAAQEVAFAPAFFTDHEHATVRLLVDLIIPADDRSGSATDAGVPEFMDFMMVDYPDMQPWMRGGLAWLDVESQRRFDATFIDASAEQRSELLDSIAWPDRATDDMSHGVAFFNRFRDLTASGFWSTEMGIEDLQYRGNTVVPEWNGCPEEALRHVGVPPPGD